MKFKTLAFLSILTILFFTGCDSKDNSQNKAQTQQADRVTEFQLETADNQTINITLLNLLNDKILFKDYPNKIVLLNFFATWCPPCKAEIPNLIQLQNDYKNDFVIVSILLEDMKTHEELQKFITTFNINYPITNASENFDLAKSLGGIKSIPTMFLVDKDGNVFQKYVGLVPSEMMEIDIKKVLAK